jgi:hypothetical protein
MARQCFTPVPTPCKPAVTGRALDDFTVRFNTATAQAQVPDPPHPTNNDLALTDKCGSYSKGIEHTTVPGKVNLAAFAKLQTAIASGKFADFEKIPLGGGINSAKLNGPMASYAWTMQGADCSLFGAPAGPMPPVPAPPGVASKEWATELVELYWCSLLRDVAFTDYSTNHLAKDAAAELSTLPTYAGPKSAGKVTPELLFRGAFEGEEFGPYVSQLLLTPTVFGAAPFDQRYFTYRPGVDYMTDLESWFAVQKGMSTGYTNQKENTPRILRDGRGLAAWTHVDELYQAYFTAYLVLESLKFETNLGNPYKNAIKQKAFGTFGGPDIAAVLGAVAKYALNAVWYQKWVIHLRHRPEAGGGLVHLIETGIGFDATPDQIIFKSEALKRSHNKYGSWLLSQPFPEGSPTHPAYPTGHGTVGGACITVLKFFYNGEAKFGSPVMPTGDGLALAPWTGQPGTGAVASMGGANGLDLNGELAKLAHNITFGHGLHGGIHWRSDSDSSMLLGEACAISFLDDLVCTYAEPVTITIKKLDGSTRKFSNV